MKAPSEHHLESWIVDNPQLFGRGDNDAAPPMFERFIARQFRLPYGVVDLIAIRRNHVCVIELKKDEIDYATICQCLRYMRQIEYIAQEQCYALAVKNNFESTGFHVRVSGLIVAHKFAAKDILMLADACHITPMLYEYTPELNRYEFGNDYQDYDHQHKIYEVEQSIWDDYLYGVLGETMRQLPRNEVNS